MSDQIPDFPDFYFETYFKLEGSMDELPLSYSIITAYATTGEKWTSQENEDADARLKAELENKDVDKWRIIGYSPTTGHTEPGWATTLSHEAACELGKRYLQHAIFVVINGELSVMLCNEKKKKVIGNISERMQAKNSK